MKSTLGAADPNIFLRSIFVSLPLILTFLAANICHFLIATLNFFMIFSSAINFVSFLFFLFCFVLFCQFRSSSFSFLCYRCQCNGSRGKQSNARSRDYEIFSHFTGYHFFFRTRESFANTHSLLRKVVNY